PIGAPVLGHLDAGAAQVAAVLAELGLEALEQSDAVGRRAGEAADGVALGHAPDLARGGLHHRVAEADLAVAGEDGAAAAADGEDGGRARLHGFQGALVTRTAAVFSPPAAWG